MIGNRQSCLPGNRGEIMRRKGQAAMEFLMTYGWAILVVIAAIAALAYFGVLDPARILPERCQFPAGMDCIDKAAIVGESDPANNDGNVTVALRNNLAFAITIQDAVLSAQTGITCASAAVDIGDGNGYVAIANNQVANNGVFRVRRYGCNWNGETKLDGTLTVSYVNTESGLQNQAVGDVRGRIT
jgi:hypothetical protein